MKLLCYSRFRLYLLNKYIFNYFKIHLVRYYESFDYLIASVFFIRAIWQMSSRILIKGI